MMTTTTDCLIVGAGIAGLLAAQRLQAAGVQIILLEAQREAGGRMATQALTVAGEPATFDHGAQYFTVREAAFRELVAGWLGAGFVRRWSSGFATPGAAAYRDGYPRYCGDRGMQQIPRQLAQTLDVRPETAVAAITHDRHWQVFTAAGRQFSAGALLLTPPVPQSLALLAAGEVSLPASAALLPHIDYEPCLALLAVLAGPSQIPPPGGVWPGNDVLYWLADNRQKGISAQPAVTLHATPEYSRASFDGDAEAITRAMLAAAAPWLGSEVRATILHRWRYSLPVHLYPGRTIFCSSPGPLAFAGDAFAGPRVEGAALSGLAAGAALAEALLAPPSSLPQKG